jgi:hypothetical protein
MNTRKATSFLFFYFLTTPLLVSQTEEKSVQPTWTFMVYMEATNDLEIFAPRNIRQMQQVGSNDTINIIVQHNVYEKNVYTSRTFFIEKGNKKLIKEYHAPHEAGEENLIHFCCDTITTYTADHYGLILWNHGTGTLEPILRSAISTTDLFSLSNSSHFFEKENKGFMPFQLSTSSYAQQQYKGICFNDVSGKFLTEKNICRALKTICATSLHNKKLDLIGFDACLMSMIEIATAVEPYVKTMIASQDVERGTGWNYYYVLFPFSFTSFTPPDFGKHIVNAYKKTYHKIADFTLSCILLEKIRDVTNNISRVAFSLQKILTFPDNKKMKLSIKGSRNKHSCTYFEEPEFIDLHHFYENLLTNFEQLSLTNPHETKELEILKKELLQGKTLIEDAVYANTAGTAYPYAKGLSIYFPEHTIHFSYKRCHFATTSQWLPFLRAYLSAYKK